MLTGRDVPDAGAWSNDNMLQPELETLPGAFSDAGYETTLVGKMHLGGSRQFAGFNNRPYGDLTGGTGHQFEPLYDNLAIHKPLMPSGMTQGDLVYGLDGNHLLSTITDAGVTDVPESMLQEQNIIRESLAWLREHRHQSPDQPWFLCASFSRPHYPYTAPERYFDRYWPDNVPEPKTSYEEGTTDDPMVRSVRDLYGVPEADEEEEMRARAGYFACVDYLDEMLEEFLLLLDAADFLENTIVVYTSDHGEMAGEHGVWGKNTWHESSSHVPLIFQLPEHRTDEVDSSSIETPVSLADLFPTLCGFAGIDTPDDLDGEDISDAIVTGDEPDRGPVFCDNFDPVKGENTEYRMVRDGQYKYVRFRDGSEHFFNLEEDPFEEQDIVDDVTGAAADVLNELRAVVDETMDFEEAAEKRAADIERKEEFELSIPEGSGNIYHMPDGRLVDADSPLYSPDLLTRAPANAFDDWPEDADSA
jgi:choline-sulfatase